MNLKIYQSYILKSFLYYFFIVSIIFLILGFFLNILEEITFFEPYNLNILYPLFLTFLNTPSLLYEIFPFIFLISSQIFIFNFYEKDELNLLKVTGIDNFSLIRLIAVTSILMGVLISTVFYTFSAEFKYNYLSIKNKFSNDNKYLAAINNNGLWIKDQYEGNIYIINADEYKNENLKNVTINKLNKDFDILNFITADQANIETYNWELNKVKIFYKDGKSESLEKLIFKSNFNKNKLDSIFSNLNSLNILQLIELSKDYKKLGYSNIEIKAHLYKLFLLPVYVSIMAVIGSILMLYLNYFNSKLFNISIGIMTSVIIYYINHFFSLLGTTEKTSVLLSVSIPLIILTMFCFIGIVKINEK